MKNVEWTALKALRDFSKANLQTYLDEIVAEEEDLDSLGFKSIRIGTADILGAKGGFPIMGMVPFESDRSAGGDDAGDLHIDIGMIFQHPDAEHLVLMQVSSVTAVLNMIEANHRLGPARGLVLARPGRVQYYSSAPNNPNNQNMNAASVRVAMTIQTDL